MARGACDRRVFASQFEIGRIVIERPRGQMDDGAFPGRRRVATRAGDAEAVFVDDRLGVARDARLRCPLENARRMARFAISGFMFAGEFEAGRVVVEGCRRKSNERSLPGGRRMATRTVNAKTAQVNFWFDVACNARLGGALKVIVLMAGGAVEGCVFARQLEGGEIVVEMGEASQDAVRAEMFGVAFAAISSGGEFAVHGGAGVDLFANIGMAGETAVRHGLAAPGRSMAGGAVAAQFGMRADAAGLRSGFVFAIESAGAEHGTAKDDEDDNCRRTRQKRDRSTGTQQAFHRAPVSAAVNVSVTASKWSSKEPRPHGKTRA